MGRCPLDSRQGQRPWNRSLSTDGVGVTEPGKRQVQLPLPHRSKAIGLQRRLPLLEVQEAKPPGGFQGGALFAKGNAPCAKTPGNIAPSHGSPGTRSELAKLNEVGGGLQWLRETGRLQHGGQANPARRACSAGRATPQHPMRDREAVAPTGGAPIPCAARISPPYRRRWCRCGSHRVAGNRDANTSNV